MSNPGQAASYATAARIGRWIIPAIPFGWNWIPGFGIQHAAQGMVPSNVCLKEDVLLAGNQLALYIQAQITIMKRTFLEPVVAGPAPLEYPGATEAALAAGMLRPYLREIPIGRGDRLGPMGARAR